MTDEEFFELAVRDYGIPPKMAAFFIRHMSRRPHTHTTDQIKDLKPAITKIVDDVLAEEIDEE